MAAASYEARKFGVRSAMPSVTAKRQCPDLIFVKPRFTFYNGVTDAANAMGIRVLSSDFKDMRNEIVHGGRLVGTRFRGPGKAECDAVAADVLNWFDEYFHKALRLGPVAKKRFSAGDFSNLNAFSIS